MTKNFAQLSDIKWSKVQDPHTGEEYVLVKDHAGNLKRYSVEEWDKNFNMIMAGIKSAKSVWDEIEHIRKTGAPMPKPGVPFKLYEDAEAEAERLGLTKIEDEDDKFFGELADKFNKMRDK